MVHTDFEKTVLAALKELMDKEGLRRVESSEERMFSTVSVGNQHAGIQAVIEWRDSYVQVDAYKCIGGNLPLRSAAAASPSWLSLKEIAELSGIHPLQEPQLTASARSDEGVASSTVQDVEAYLADLVPLLRRVCTPWFRGNLESFDALVRARDALLAEPEPGGTEATHWTWTVDLDVHASTPAFVAGVLDACGRGDGLAYELVEPHSGLAGEHRGGGTLRLQGPLDVHAPVEPPGPARSCSPGMGGSFKRPRFSATTWGKV